MGPTYSLTRILQSTCKVLPLLLLLIIVVPSYMVAGDNDHSPDYPPYGSHVPIAHFDHKVRPQLTPPTPQLLSDGSGRPAQSEWNMELVGYDTLDGRSTYQPLVVRQGHRYIAYMAHHAGTAINRLTGLSETNGTSLLDVTDPHNPVYLAHIPGPGGSVDAGGNQMAHVCSGDVLPSNSHAEAERKRGKYYLLRSNGNTSGAANPGTESQQIFDVTDPAHPVPLATIVAQLTNTHKNWWECDTGIAYLVANDSSLATPRPDLAPGWHHSGSTQHLKIYNLHDPANPEYIRDFGFVGQQPNVGSTIEGLVTPPTGIHGPISASTEKNRVYMPYGVGGNGVVEIVDREKLLKGCTLPTASANCAISPTEAEMLAPQISFFTLPGGVLQGGHSSFPIYGKEDGKRRDVLAITSEEGGNECTAGSAPHAVWLFDVTKETSPQQISVDPNDPANTLLDVPNGFDYTWTYSPHTFAAGGVYPASLTPTDNPANPNSFCNQGARFGTHAVPELFYPPYYGKLIIASWFTGGVRLWDIRNPDAARPIAYFIPGPNGPYTVATPNGCGPAGGPSPGFGCTFSNSGRNGHTVFAIHTNNPEVDDRGFIYLADRSGTGMHILKLTGDAKKVVEGDSDDRGDRDDHGHH